MWTTAHTLDTDVDRESLWSTFAALHCGELQLPGMDTHQAAAPLQVGTPVEVSPEGAERMLATVTEFEPPARYAEEAHFDDLLLTFRHRFEQLAGGTRITQELVIDGDGSDEVGPELGPDIAAGFPDQLALLVDAARHRRRDSGRTTASS